MEEQIVSWLTAASYYPGSLYLCVVFILTLSSFGLPLPEEVVLVTSGFIANLALSEAVLNNTPPTINPFTLATVCFLAVIMSDLLVFSLGRIFGLRLFKKWPLNKFMNDSNRIKVEEWTQRFGLWACALFRFTPGLRFPGHFMCGALKITYPQFLITDGLAALISVPTQVLLLAFYGQEILVYFKKFKIFIFIVALLFIFYFIYAYFKKNNFSSSAK